MAALVPILAVELKPLRVNGVSPGVIDTPWWDAMPEEQKQAMFADFASKTPVGRVGRPEDVADAIGFLIRNDFITGQHADLRRRTALYGVSSLPAATDRFIIMEDIEDYGPTDRTGHSKSGCCYH